ncbi:MAG: hypothetical protein ACRC4N_03300 [Gammaproteobacteria bacterium]
MATNKPSVAADKKIVSVISGILRHSLFVVEGASFILIAQSLVPLKLK